MRMMRMFVGLLLIPCCFAVTKTVLSLLMASPTGVVGPEYCPRLLALAAGFGLWVLIFLVLPAPIKTYVAAHELTHALWGALMGARVSGLRVSNMGGSVKLSEHNVLVVLAPYFFPLYTVLVLLLYGASALFLDPRPLMPLWFGAMGLTLGFHVTFAVMALAQGQSDVRVYGRLFSYTVIYLMNLLILGVVMVLIALFPLERFIAGLIRDLVGVWAWCGAMVLAGIRQARIRF